MWLAYRTPETNKIDENTDLKQDNSQNHWNTTNTKSLE